MEKTLSKKTFEVEKDRISKHIDEIFNTLSGQIKDLDKKANKALGALDKKLEEVESTADSAESLAGDVELDLENLTALVNSLIANKE